MRRILFSLAGLAVLGAAAVWFLTAPKTLSAEDLPDHTGDASAGAYVFHMAGCASCHAAPGAKGEEKLKLAGGMAFRTPFGTFVAPNISPDPVAGIGGWSDLDLANALTRGASPDGTHYYPALPYMSYQRMALTDILDLKAYLDTLPPVTSGAGARSGVSVQYSAGARTLESDLHGLCGVHARSGGGRAGQSRRLYRHRAGPLRRMPHAA